MTEKSPTPKVSIRPVLTLGLVLEGETILFNDRIGQDFFGDPLYFRLRIGFIQAVERDLEEFPLANRPQALVSHLVQGSLNGLALGVEHALL
jgi:hypothetical protein